MLVRFWGTRGSIPVAPTSAAIQRKLVAALMKAAGRALDTPDKARAFVERELDFAVSHTFGGNSSCVEIETGTGEYVLCDMGSGARPFAVQALARHGPGRPQTYHVLISHPHWDHIMGFPFFLPGYIPGNVVRIYGCHPALEEAFRRQHGPPSFPVAFGQLGAKIEFVRLMPGQPNDVAGLSVTPKLQQHGGDSYGYRIERAGRTLVYSTDSEHKLDKPETVETFVAFFREADLVIFDAQYSLADAMSVKEDWGHSSNIVGVERCQRARAKHLCLYHHEPMLEDEQLATLLGETRRFEEITRGDHRLEVSVAYDGMELTL